MKDLRLVLVMRGRIHSNDIIIIIIVFIINKYDNNNNNNNNNNSSSSCVALECVSERWNFQLHVTAGLWSSKRFVYTAISKKVVIVNSRHWNRKELLGSSSWSNLLLLAKTLHNIECRFIIMPRPYSKKTSLARSHSLCMIIPKVPFGSSMNY